MRKLPTYIFVALLPLLAIGQQTGTKVGGKDFVELYYRPIGGNESVWITTLNFYIAADR